MQRVLKNSQRFLRQAKECLVGGVNSPVRSFGSVEADMLFAKKAKGAYIWDADNNRYIDYVMSWGVSIFGHCYKPVMDAVAEIMKEGFSFGLSTQKEIILANMIKRRFKSIDKIRLVNSGTEACMSAIRLARAFTGKSRIIKFDGCYHGHFDSLLVRPGSGNLTFGIPSGKGILEAYTRDTISLPFNDIEILKKAIKKNRDNLACVIVEPVPCNMGLVLPKTGFLEKLRRLTSQHDILLIFDEVISGLRLSPGGAEELYGIKPDLTCLGKIMGGGFPVGAYGGRQEIMELLAPEGLVYQAGTLSGNPLAVAAGIKVLEEIQIRDSLYADLQHKTDCLVSEIRQAAAKFRITLQVNKIGSLFSIFFTAHPVTNQSEVLSSDQKRYAALFNLLAEEGVLLPPSPFEACFVSRAHRFSDIEQTASAFKKAFSAIRRSN